MLTLIKIDHITSGVLDSPDTSLGVESDYINLGNVASITPIIYCDDNGHYDYTINIAYISGDNARLDVPPRVYDNLLNWLDNAVIFDGGAM